MTDTEMTPRLFSVTLLLSITCESDSICRSVFEMGRGTYRDAWRAAYSAGWRTDLSGVRRCPACVAERQPSYSLWLDGPELTGYLAGKAALPDDLTPQTVICGVSQATREPEAAAPPEPDEPAPVLNPVAEGALKRFEQAHAEEDEREATSIIPATSAETEAIPAVTEEGR